MIKAIKLAGKYLDQPLLVSKFKSKVPPIFIGGAAIYGANEVRKEPKEKRLEKAINTTFIMTATVASALAAPRIAAKIVRKPYEKFDAKEIIKKNTAIVDEFLSKEKVSEKTATILEKAKTKVLKFKEIKTLDRELGVKKTGKSFFNQLIPEPENVTSKDIRNEIGRLSILGFIPVAGGIAGGIAGEKITNKKLEKNHTANRVKEGAYQYLANIFLCNIGAGLALAGLEHFNVKSKSARVVGMVGGILTTGVIGGNYIANYIGQKLINPIFEPKEARKKKESLTSERKPEVLDICLHSDDIATIAVMSGLKWMEPALPILYGISGYRAGIGYRNGDKYKKQNEMCDNEESYCTEMSD